MIISSGGSFAAYYILDGGKSTHIKNSEVINEPDTSQYTFERNLNKPTSIELVVTGNTDTKAIYVYIYENGKKVASKSDSVTEVGDVAIVELYHEFLADSGSTTQ
jgi:hypothetical protein